MLPVTTHDVPTEYMKPKRVCVLLFLHSTFVSFFFLFYLYFFLFYMFLSPFSLFIYSNYRSHSKYLLVNCAFNYFLLISQYIYIYIYIYIYMPPRPPGTRVLYLYNTAKTCFFLRVRSLEICAIFIWLQHSMIRYNASILNDNYIVSFTWNFISSHLASTYNKTMTVFWDVAPCSLVEFDWHFRVAYCLSEASVSFYETARCNTEYCRLYTTVRTRNLNYDTKIQVRNECRRI
jgi:hypothetical protein